MTARAANRFQRWLPVLIAPVGLELTDDATEASVALAAVELSRMELVATLAP